MKGYLALDVGGTKVAAGVVTGDGAVLSRLRIPTRDLRIGGNPLARLIVLGQEALDAAGGRPPAGVGITLPGPVDRRELRMRAAPTIPEFEGLPLAGALEDAFGCPAAGDNDANGCALAEARFGAGRGYSHVVYLTVSTGIGGGIVVDGRVFRGAAGASGEFGHQVLLPEGGPLCDCGNTGCLEALASGRGIAARARLAQANAPEGTAPRWSRADLTAEVVAEAARAGDLLALRVWQETALYLGLGIANAINILDPDVVVLGGGVATGAADLLFPSLREVVSRRCMPSLRRSVPILPTALGADVGLIGAACLAMET
jgi:glucokinase